MNVEIRDKSFFGEVACVSQLGDAFSLEPGGTPVLEFWFLRGS